MSLKDIINDEEKLRDVARVGFENVDTDKSGYIDIKELGKVMTDISKDLGVDTPTPEDIQEVMTKLDTDKSGNIEFEEFVVLMKDILINLAKAEENK